MLLSRQALTALGPADAVTGAWVCVGGWSWCGQWLKPPLAPPPDLDEDDEEAEAARFFARGEGEGAAAYARRVFGRVFGSDIEKVLTMEVRAGGPSPGRGAMS